MAQVTCIYASDGLGGSPFKGDGSVVVGALLNVVECCSHCLCGFCVWSLFCYALISVLSSFSSFTIILATKRELIALL